MRTMGDDDPRVQLRLDRIERDAVHQKANPFTVLLRLEGSPMTYMWGRFKTEARAVAAGQSAMQATRRENLPYGKHCTGYIVTDNRTEP